MCVNTSASGPVIHLWCVDELGNLTVNKGKIVTNGPIELKVRLRVFGMAGHVTSHFCGGVPEMLQFLRDLVVGCAKLELNHHQMADRNLIHH